MIVLAARGASHHRIYSVILIIAFSIEPPQIVKIYDFKRLEFLSHQVLYKSNARGT